MQQSDCLFLTTFLYAIERTENNKNNKNRWKPKKQLGQMFYINTIYILQINLILGEDRARARERHEIKKHERGWIESEIYWVVILLYIESSCSLFFFNCNYCNDRERAHSFSSYFCCTAYITCHVRAHAILAASRDDEFSVHARIYIYPDFLRWLINCING